PSTTWSCSKRSRLADRLRLAPADRLRLAPADRLRLASRAVQVDGRAHAGEKRQGPAVNLRRYRDLAIVLLALAVPFWFLRASMRDPTKQSTGPDRFIVRIAAPIQYAAATLARGISTLFGDYVYLVDVKEDNRSLASQNARLRERVHKLEALE